MHDRLPEPRAHASLDELSDSFRSVDWLWPSWIPNGFLTVLAGAPGAGKSLVALDVARRVIHSIPFPDGAPGCRPGSKVLFVDAEGSTTLVHQRARAWQIDCQRLFLTPRAGFVGVIDLGLRRQQLNLAAMVRDIRPALVIVDSLAAAAPGAEASVRGARGVLNILSAIASGAGIAVLGIHHLRKQARLGRVVSNPRVSADDLRGSSHISAAARSILALSSVIADPRGPTSCTAPHGPRTDGVVPKDLTCSESPGRDRFAASPPVLRPDVSPPASLPQKLHVESPRRLEVIKANLCRRPPPLGLMLRGKDLETPSLHYTEWVDPPSQPTLADQCALWLLEFLAAAGEPVKPAVVVEAAGSEGYPRSTLYRARKALGAMIHDLGNSPRDPNKLWCLRPEREPHPNHGPPDSDTATQ